MSHDDATPAPTTPEATTSTPTTSAVASPVSTTPTATSPAPVAPVPTTVARTTPAAGSGTVASAGEPSPAVSDDGGLGGTTVAVLLLAVALLAAAAGYLLGRRRRPNAESLRPAARPAVGTSTHDAGAEQALLIDPTTQQQRGALAEGLIDARDRIGPGAVSDRIGEVLDGVGIETIDPTGERFDATNHTAQTPPAMTPDRALDGVVAGVVSYGYAERGTVRRLPVVVVYRYEGGAGG